MALLPLTMRALRQVRRVANFKPESDLASCLELHVVDVPVPRHGQVLLKVECAAVNPSNLAMLQGLYADSGSTPLPVFTGTEGSGTVVASGGGLLPWWLQGKRVGALVPSGGMWAEYVVADASLCIQLPETISFEVGTSCFVNPLTCSSFVRIAQSRHVKAIVNTAAASALGTPLPSCALKCSYLSLDAGKMLARHAAEHDIQIIGVVRSQAQVDDLAAWGVKHIVNTSEPHWTDQLTQFCSKLNATVGFECVGGDLPGQVQACMPPNSELFVYGNLTGDRWAAMSPGDLRYNNKRISGFFLFRYLEEQGWLRTWRMRRQVARKLSTTFHTDVSASHALDDAVVAIQHYANHMTNSKIILKPSQH
ncbi:hypothetical protein B5M09_007678 [Aphanomyces astaci]|uniref:Enoyl reductase (ER) domain-containing protein n=1 Tax=Aphanomyces astaci TaxID=112090 RepID=A0A425CPH4_APHAT|nr:hypothetical protein B5M09_007678 [Aphanomyces astaci]